VPIASARKTSPPLTPGMKNVDQSSAVSSSQTAIRKPSTPQSAEIKETENNGGIDEVVFLRLPEVKGMTGLSKSSLYALIQERSFPKPVRLGARTVAWVRSEVRQWAFERISASR